MHEESESVEEAGQQGPVERGKVLSLLECVEYSQGSIVSRSVVDSENGNITLFAFEEGTNLSEHTAPFDAVAAVIDGRAQFIIGGETLEAQAGQTVIMPADVPHAVRAPARFKMMLIMIW